MNILLAILFFILIGITKLAVIVSKRRFPKKVYKRNLRGEFMSEHTTAPQKGIRKPFVIREMGTGRIIRYEYTSK